jgi:hypothetical protein
MWATMEASWQIPNGWDFQASDEWRGCTLGRWPNRRRCATATSKVAHQLFVLPRGGGRRSKDYFVKVSM